MSTIPSPASLQQPTVDDGTEFRAAVVRTREGGIQELLDAHGPGAFFRVHGVRVSIVDGHLYLQFDANLKKEERHVFLGVDVFVPISDLKVPTEDAEETP